MAKRPHYFLLATGSVLVLIGLVLAVTAIVFALMTDWTGGVWLLAPALVIGLGIGAFAVLAGIVSLRNAFRSPR